ncbi:unnamed protein product [Calypogeia fissa]
MNWTMPYFWMHFVAQTRLILESISLANIEEFSLGAGLIDKVEGLYQHNTKKGERDLEYKQFLAESYIADLFFENKEKNVTILEGIRLVPSHIYKLPEIGTLTRALVTEVVIQDREHPRNPKAAKKSISTERMGEGPSDPLLVGLPAPLPGTTKRA